MKLAPSSPLKRSHWMQQTTYQTDAVQTLTQTTTADIAILGGGFVGLWTAITIKEQQPDADVVIIEQDICGGGASGRNGGFVMSWWPKISSLQSFCSQEEALFLAHSAENAITELGEFCAQHRIDAHFNQKGWLWTATTPAHINSWASTIAACKQLGVSPFEELSAQEVARRTGSNVHLAGVFEASNATVQPALLVRGMRQVALSLGVRIYEHTAATAIHPGKPVTVTTQQGQVSCQQLVLASNAWSVCIPQLRSLIVPVNSSIAVTEAMPQQLAQQGWSGGESITDSQLLVNYYRTTHDGRIAFGKGTGAIMYGERIGEVFSEHAASIKITEEQCRQTYPQLGQLQFSDAWSGPIDRTYDSLPVFGQLQNQDNIHFGIGWSGNGVGPSRLGGRIMASLALGQKNPWSTCALVNRKVRHFPAEPIRYVGGTLVRNAVMRKEAQEMAGKTPSWKDVMLAKFAPAGLEDKSV